MNTRRGRGDGSLFWDKARERWVAEVTVGYDGRGKRRIKKGTGRTKTDAKRKLREVLLSDSGIPIEEISRLVGHSSTTVTEQVYRHQIRPVIQDGAIAMDRLFR